MAPWSHVEKLDGCDRCSADAFRILPYRFPKEIKRAISGGLMLEMVTAEAFLTAGGEVYEWDSGQANVHHAGLRFDCPAKTLECDLLADLGTTTFYVECKDKATGNTLSTTEDIELAEARAGRLFKQVKDDEKPNGPWNPAILIVTTGRLSGAVDKSGLEEGALSASSLPVHIIEGDELLNIVEKLGVMAGIHEAKETQELHL